MGKWRPRFVVDEVTISSAVVWARIPCLPTKYFQEYVIFKIAKLISRPIHIDVATSDGARGRFARFRVEMDLKMPIVVHI